MEAVTARFSHPRTITALWIGAGLVAMLACGSPQERKSTMTPSGVDREQILSAELIPSISDSSASMVVARITAVHLIRQHGTDPEIETGTIALSVLEPIRSHTLSAGSAVEVPAWRMADPILRVRNGINQWNRLSLKEGELLLIAVKPTGSPGLWQALAARQLQSAADPLVAAARQCYAIESEEATARKREMLAGALASNQDLLTFYALDALGRRDVLGREAGAELIARAIVTARIAPAEKLELGSYLGRLYFFRPDAKSDRANQMVLVALAHGLVNAPGPENRVEWATELASALGNEFSSRPGENSAVRLALIRSVASPQAGQVLQALAEVLQQAPREERPRIKELMNAWREAFPGAKP
jgi:hypothetical protein